MSTPSLVSRPGPDGITRDQQGGKNNQLRRLERPDHISVQAAAALVSAAAGFPASFASTAPAPASPAEPATPRQLRYLRLFGVPTPPTLTKKKAQQLINKAKVAKKAHV